MEEIIIKIQHLLLHSVRETDFYDRATDQIITSELKSVFAKYLWVRGEHIMGIRSFLRSADQPIPKLASFCYHNERFWNFFIDAAKRKDNATILRAGMRFARLTMHKYDEVIEAVNGSNRLKVMLHNQVSDIRELFEEFSMLQTKTTSSLSI